MSFLRTEIILAIIVGVAAGAWPLVMKASGLTNSGHVAVIYSAVSLIAAIALSLIVPAQAASMGASWPTALVAGSLAAAALIAMSLLVVKCPPNQIGRAYLMVMVIQILTPALWSVGMGLLRDGTVSARQISGVGAALIAAVLLSK